MAKITFQNLAHSYFKSEPAENWALKPIDLVLESGRPYALVGPSGCGKTTILNIISGIITPKQGKILFDNDDVTNLPVKKRNVAQVFQFPTIYKSMNVFDNLAFPLICRNMEKNKIKERVGEIAEQIGISNKLNRSAFKLGADEKQLVSLGRGLVRDDVTALLMDEPLTVIDPQLKFELRKKIKQIVEGKNITIIYVTHDQYEAMTFADELLVMSLGVLVQRGTPEQLFEVPATKYVGNFIGSPAMNFLKVEADNGKARFGNLVFDTNEKVHNDLREELEIGIRPEYVKVAKSADANTISATILERDNMGAYQVLNCKVDGGFIKMKVGMDEVSQGTSSINLLFPKEKLHLYHKGELIAN